MSIYYSYAKSKSGKVLKIPIESKHLYKNSPLLVGDTLKDYYGGPTGHKMGYKAEMSSPYVLYLSNYMNDEDSNKILGWRWQRGTGPDQVIGDKIQIKSVQFHFEFSLDADSFAMPASSDLSWGTANFNRTRQNPIMNNDDSTESYFPLENKSWRRDYRLQVIHFEQDMPASVIDIQELLAQWYDCTYVPTVHGVASTISAAEDPYGYTNIISNKATMLRESTPFTGKFNIMKDFSFSLSDTKPYHIVEFSLDPKRQVNLVPVIEGEGESAQTFYEISDDWWLNTVVVLWSPLNYDMDMDPMSAQALKTVHDDSTVSGINMGHYRYYIKLTYYDV